ncbi:TIGR02530 family flagellar biosynthesis protein [candidate division KSB1 bacterium]
MIKTNFQNFRPVNISVGDITGRKMKQPESLSNSGKAQFGDILKGKIGSDEELKFSSHAIDRMNARDISLSYDDITKINNAVSQASTKGAVDSLVVLNDLAFIVSVKNRTIITAMTKESMQENVFTNIDSAVFA